MSKRLFDVVGASAGLVLLSPLLLASVVWIKLDSAGPVFVREQRVGQDGVLFRLIQFRTTAQAGDVSSAAAGRGAVGVSRAGRLLRRYGVDKLPQLLNVIQGAMSLVGPAPALPEVIATYPPQLRARALSFIPGIVDWISVVRADEQALLRGAAERGPADRGPADRGPDNRGSTGRGPADRRPTERVAAERGPTERGPAERGPAERGPAERGPADPEQVFLEAILPRRLEYYARYAEQRSFWLDLRILLHSLSVPAD